MEFGEMKRTTLNWSNFCMLLRRAGLIALAGLSCYTPSGWCVTKGQKIFFWLSVDIFLGGVQKLRKATKQVQMFTSFHAAGASKLSWSKTTLKHCTNTEILCNWKLPSLSFPELCEIFSHWFASSWRADALKDPSVSTALGARRWLLSILAYCFLFARGGKFYCSSSLVSRHSESHGTHDVVLVVVVYYRCIRCEIARCLLNAGETGTCMSWCKQVVCTDCVSECETQRVVLV